MRPSWTIRHGCLQTEMRPLMRERFDLLSLKFARKTVGCHGEGELSFSPLTHIFLSCPSPSPHASQSDSPLPLVFVWHYPSLEASVRLCACAIHHRIRAFFWPRERALCLSQHSIKNHFGHNERTWCSFPWLKWNWVQKPTCAFSLSPSVIILGTVQFCAIILLLNAHLSRKQ